MISNYRIKLFSALFVLVLICGFAACEKKSDSAGGGNASGNTIKIGEYGSLTGDKATFGISTKNGIELAQQEYNQAGGILGKQIEIVVEDDRGLAQEATTVVQKLIDKDHVVAILGEVASTNSLAGGQVCQEKKIPMISPSSTNPDVTKDRDYIFRVCFIDPFQGSAMAKFAANSLKAKKVAILQDNGSDYSKGLTEFFTNTFKQLGGEILLTESYVSSDNDFSAQLTKIAAVKPDAIYVPGYYTQAGQIAQQARRAGITAPLMGGDGWDSPQLTEIGKEAINGCFFSNHYSVEDTAQNVQDFVSKYKQKYGQVPDALAALAYDAARIMFESIKKAGTTDGKILRETIAQTKEFKGVTGSITINKDRNADKPLTILEIKDGKYAFRENVSAN
jgi:branched-chain amino acid transport system substrate-binding protein